MFCTLIIEGVVILEILTCVIADVGVVGVVKSQVSLSGGSLQQSKQTSIPQTLQQVITQNSAGQPVLSFIRMAGNQNTTQQNIVQFVNPSASASPRPQASQQQGMVYLIRGCDNLATCPILPAT
jgi:hypothetical protein